MDHKLILTELKLKGIRSSGAGGQNVNKVATKIELTFNIGNSLALSDSEKELLLKKLQHRISKDTFLILQCDESRSQLKNKKIIIARFLELIFEALKKPKIRRSTKPTKSSIQKRLDTKKLQSDKKAHRKKFRF
ncbi:alternative ribosome rescue aminoacyl-tRNA hydrolase ArfB [Flavicella marina]|uniref:alternative ribosome rescue aminoacyl-tRNA hydrolase ArfB n=1 Tax=Flavicella marina TaxID=1475951 RepID=UPI0012655861|nr:alternative ribosome rescue aminoacyl-tRNA hydrolase ArfB [Flavicella marina]